MATLEELQKRIQRLEDIKQIEKLQRIRVSLQRSSTETQR